MTTCLAEFITASATPIAVRRYGVGTYDEHGRYTDGKVEEVEILANVQPLNGRDLMRLPENERTREAILIFSVDELRTTNVDGRTQADVVLYHGDEYEVDRVENWHDLGGFFKATATRRKQ